MITLCEMSKVEKSEKVNDKWVLYGGEGEYEIGKSLLKNTVSFWIDKNVLKLDCGDGGTIL